MLGLPQLLLSITFNWNALSHFLNNYFSNTTVVVFYNADNALDVSLLASEMPKFSKYLIYNDREMEQTEIPSILRTRNSHFLFLPGRNFNESLKNWHHTSWWDPRGRTVILPTVVSGSSSATAHKLLAAAWEQASASNAAVITPNGEIFTWTPNGPYECGEVRSLRRPDPEEVYETNVNMRGCILRASVSAVMPYVSPELDPNGDFILGLEVDMVQAITNTYGMRISYVKGNTEANESQWTNRRPNGSLAGAMGRLDRHEADIAFSSLSLTTSRFSVAEALFPHTDEEVTWFVPAPQPKLVQFYFLKSFNLGAWGAVLAILAGITLGLYMSEPRYSVCDASQCAVEALLSSPVRPAHTARARVLTQFMYLCSLHLLIAYQTTLLINLVRPEMGESVNSIEEAMTQNLEIRMLRTLGDFYHPDDPAWDALMASDRWKYTSSIFEDLKCVAQQRNCMILRLRNVVAYYSRARLKLFDSRGELLIKAMSGRFTALPISIYMYQGHPMWPSFQMATLYILEAGLQEQWLSGYLNFKRKDEHEGHAPSATSNTLITTAHLSGVFYCYLSMLAVSLFIFFSEHLYNFLKLFHKRT